MGERWNAAMNCWGENPSPLRKLQEEREEQDQEEIKLSALPNPSKKQNKMFTTLFVTKEEQDQERLNFLLCPILTSKKQNKIFTTLFITEDRFMRYPSTTDSHPIISRKKEQRILIHFLSTKIEAISRLVFFNFPLESPTTFSVGTNQKE
jgi:hypothetical protein